MNNSWENKFILFEDKFYPTKWQIKESKTCNINDNCWIFKSIKYEVVSIIMFVTMVIKLKVKAKKERLIRLK